MPNLKVLAGVAVLCTPLVGVVALGVVAGGVASADASTGLTFGSTCATSGPIAGLSNASAANARIVVATASSRGGDRVGLIAVMTGLAESGLRILSNPHDPSGDRYPGQGVGYDHDSLGIFQQRPNWGSAAQRMDPVASTNLFVTRLLSLPGWQSLPPWQAAQRVQASAFADGSNYRAQLDRATAIVAAVSADAATVDCEGSTAGVPANGPVDAYGLPSGYVIPAGTSAKARAALTFALAQRGKPYVWAAAGPDSYDCSGLMSAAWARAGIVITHFTGLEAGEGTPTTVGRLLPGDLVLVPGSRGNLASPRHVGMYLGDGLVVHAPMAGDVVRVVTFDSFVSGGVSTLRHIS